MKRVRAIMAPAALFAWLAAGAGPAAAGAGGRCASLQRSDSRILFCEDFEDPAYNRAGPLSKGHAWYERFGAASPNQNCEGAAPPCGVDVVASGQCNAPGESGASCVFDGAQSLGFPYRAGSAGGNLGELRFSASARTTFGVTLALRMSSTLAFQTSAKFDRLFGPQRAVDGTMHELLGTNNNEGYVGKRPEGALNAFLGAPRNTPFQALWDQDRCATATAKLRKPCSDQSRAVVNVGQWGENDVHMVAQPSVDGSLYSYPGRAPGGGAARGQWLCFQFHVRGWGSADARLRWWINGRPVMDVEHVDMSRVRGADKGGLYGLRFENFVNGSGYSGSAYRYEDNLVITSADEPVACAAIGFEGMGGGPPRAEPPGPPVLLPTVLE
jgi:hypothetical protein